jgi:hypothetical protein
MLKIMKLWTTTTTYIIVLTFLLDIPCVKAASSSLDISKIETITSLKGSYNEEDGVFKITLPRTDVKISVDGFQMPPFMGLTSWAAFQKGIKVEAMVMGDLVLFEDEVNPVMSAALENGLNVTALHNHFFYDNPKVYFMHIGGEGSVEMLATGVQRALETIKKIRSEQAEPSRSFNGKPLEAKSSITSETLEDILGLKGQTKDGMFKAVFGRKTKMPCGCDAGKEMGVNTWAAFAGTDENAIVDGDFAVVEDELQPVLKSLRSNGINIVAIHHHMTHETPRILFLHYWGKGKSADLAKNLKNTLNLQGK